MVWATQKTKVLSCWFSCRKEPEEYQLTQAIEAFKILISAEKGKISKQELELLLSEKGKEITIPNANQ